MKVLSFSKTSLLLLGSIFYISNTFAIDWVQSGDNIYFDGANVGIGVATPNQLLTLKAANGKILILDDTGVGTQSIMADGSLGVMAEAGIVSLVVDSNGGDGATGAIKFGAGMDNYSPNYTGGLVNPKNEWMRIVNGKVGIGTASPVAELDVVGKIRMTSGSLSFYHEIYRDDVTGRMFFENNQGLGYAFNGGDVGIGTQTPETKLDVNGSASIRGGLLTGGTAIELNYYGTGDRNSYIDFHSDDINTDYSARIIRVPGENADFIFQQRGAGDYKFYTNTSQEKVRLTSGGNLGIGTATPNEKLHVAGNIKLSGNLISDGDICI
ncbi:MAG: hypothetical protein OEL89_04425, partial [Candidatus Peregrinibacteria bacterium]|nr:hypothetical protein [Candidatus Peregrinibacteria bacterium]